MTRTLTSYRPPRWSLLQTEGLRTAAETAAYFCSLPRLTSGEPGDGHHVLVLPGLMADDSSTRWLRRVLLARGFQPHPWLCGVNVGPTRHTMDSLEARLETLADRGQGPMSLVGWSLGGTLARELARLHPEKVRCVVTLGSPFRLTARHSPYSTHAGWIYHALRRWHTDILDHGMPEEERPPIEVPTTAVYSRRDGIVPWEACQNIPGDIHENVEVAASHFGMGVSPEVIRIVVDRLAQPVGKWRPYDVTAPCCER